MIWSGTTRRAGAATVAAALAVVTLAGCGSSGSGTSGNSPAPTSGSSAGSGSGNNAAAVAAIKTAYRKFFAPDTPEKVSLSLLQNGQAFKATIDKQAKGQMASGASVKVDKVTVTSPTTAKVRFTIYVNKQPMLKNQPGYAVKNNGTWQVSEYTFCGLLTLEGSAPAECKKPAATTPPK